MMQRKKTIVLVTGGTRGIGLAIARRFLAQAAPTRVVVCARKPPEAGLDPDLEFEACDVRDADAVSVMINTIVARHGQLDVLVNNAGGSPYADAATASPRFFASIIALNLTAPLFCAQAANAIMQGQETGGVILNIASVSGTRPSPGTAAYGAAKAGLLNLTQSLAVEWAPKVRLVAVVAGLVRTEHGASHYGSAEGEAAAAATVPLLRFALPDDVADACLFAASAQASYLTGTAITLHGGGETPAFLDAVRRVAKARAGS